MYRGKKSLVDTRSCVLCGSIGDTKQCGRLLHFRDKDWVHVNCALWSSEVYEEVDGSLQNVGQAVSRGLKLSCTICYKKGTSKAVVYQTNLIFTCKKTRQISIFAFKIAK